MVPEFLVLFFSLVTAYLYSTKLMQITNWYIYLVFNTILIFLLIESKSLLTLYLLFELISIVIYSFIGTEAAFYLNLRANVTYFLIGFLGSLSFLFGVYLKISFNLGTF